MGLAIDKTIDLGNNIDDNTFHLELDNHRAYCILLAVENKLHGPLF